MQKYDDKCANCGKKDANGTHEVDHIAGSNNNIDNLQLLCVICHREKTMSNIVSEREDDPRREEIEIHVKELKERVFPPNPIKLCDDYGSWPEIESKIRESEKIEFLTYTRQFLDFNVKREKIFPSHIADRLNETGIPTNLRIWFMVSKVSNPCWNTSGIKRVYNPSEQTMEYLLPD